jgi:hypothetical protein
MFCTPNQESGTQRNVTLVGVQVGRMKTQSVQQHPILFNIFAHLVKSARCAKYVFINMVLHIYAKYAQYAQQQCFEGLYQVPAAVGGCHEC